MQTLLDSPSAQQSLVFIQEYSLDWHCLGSEIRILAFYWKFTVDETQLKVRGSKSLHSRVPANEWHRPQQFLAFAGHSSPSRYFLRYLGLASPQRCLPRQNPAEFQPKSSKTAGWSSEPNEIWLKLSNQGTSWHLSLALATTNGSTPCNDKEECNWKSIG